MAGDPSELILEAQGCVKVFARGGLLGRKSEGFRALDDVSLKVHRGEVVGLVGESGSGKTTLGRAVCRLMSLDAGRVVFDGEDLYKIPLRQLRQRRRDFQMLFQNPASTLHPRMMIREVLAESLRLHRGLQGKELRDGGPELLARVKLAGREEAYPMELSGGQQRRVGVARMLAARPKFVVADEPTSGLDALLRADIIDLLLAVREEGVAYLIISHDLNVIQRACSRVAVMYRGRILEELRVQDMQSPPFQPYTEELFQAAARLRGDTTIKASTEEMSSEAPPPNGCVYLPRCNVAKAHPELAAGRCTHEIPQLKPYGPARLIACHHFDSAREAV